jgi:hypothetical protein
MFASAQDEAPSAGFSGAGSLTIYTMVPKTRGVAIGLIHLFGRSIMGISYANESSLFSRNLILRLNSSKVAVLLGLGLDGRDGHKRLTTGGNFVLVGGSKETHERLQDTAMGINRELDKRGKRLEEVSREEFSEIADRVGLRVVSSRE